MRICPTPVACVLVAIVGVVAVTSAQRDTTERHVFVGVTDAGGAPKLNLTAADFVVREDDVPREVVRVSPAPPPSDVALLVDDSGQLTPAVIELRSNLVTFVLGMSALPTPPRISLTTFAERPTVVVPPTTSDIVLDRAIQRIFPRTGSGSYLLDAIVETAQALRKAKAQRPVIVAFVLESSPFLSDVVHTEVDAALKDAGASLWTVLLQQRVPGMSVPERERNFVVNDSTRRSGGMNVPALSPLNIEAGFAAVSASILGRYDVTYGRPESLVPPSRLLVETRDRSLRITAPQWTGR